MCAKKSKLFGNEDWEEPELNNAVDWDEEGKTVEGIIQDIREIKTRFGNSKIADMINEQTGEIFSVWLNPVMIGSYFRQKGLEPGDGVAIRYQGKDGQSKMFQFKHVKNVKY